MKISTSMELVWQLAAKEAIAGNFAEIDPDHFFMALLKFSEIPPGDLDKISPPDGPRNKPFDEVKFLKDVFADQRIDSTTTRRALRSQKGRGNHPFKGAKLHRSEDARRLFEKAAEIVIRAGEQFLTTKQLSEAILSSPTPIIAQFLSGDMGPQTPVKQTAPFLIRYGIDLARYTQRRMAEDVSDRKAEAIALMLALNQPKPPCVVLVNENESIIQVVVKAAARLLAAGTCPPELKGTRIMDVSSVVPGDIAFTIADLISDIQQIFTEADAAKNVFLSGLPFASFGGQAWPDELREAIKGMIRTSAVKCIFGLSPHEHAEQVKRDPSWRRSFASIWVRDEVKGEIPTEL